VLTDGIVLLRLWEAGDRDFVIDLFNDPTVQEFTPVARPFTTEMAEVFVTTAYERWREGASVAFAVLDAGTGTRVGQITLRLSPNSPSEVAYSIASSQRSKGYATAALRLVTEWALTDPALESVTALIDEANMPSRRVAEKARFHESSRRPGTRLSGSVEVLYERRCRTPDQQV
jgi:ribosomal-protein-alanine N-acetyltransferase